MTEKLTKFLTSPLAFRPHGLQGCPKTGKDTQRSISGSLGATMKFYQRQKQKASKTWCFCSNLTTFEMFLTSISFITSWSHPNSLKSSSMGPFHFFDTLGTHGGAMLVEISRILSLFLSFLAQSALQGSFSTFLGKALDITLWYVAKKQYNSHSFHEFFCFF